MRKLRILGLPQDTVKMREMWSLVAFLAIQLAVLGRLKIQATNIDTR
jgi:hypothetical protein